MSEARAVLPQTTAEDWETNNSWGNPPKNFFGDDIPLGAKKRARLWP